jgi:hypothetical protein
MAIINDGSSGNTSGGMCWIDPADMAAQVNSLMERVARLEQFVSLLFGTDITINQLSDITQDLGNVLAGNLGGGLLADMVTNIARVQAWAWIDSSLIIDGPSNAAGGIRMTTSSTLHNRRVLSSDFGYTASVNVNGDSLAGGSYLNAPVGGFYYETRIAPCRSDGAEIMPAMRVAAGLGANGNGTGSMFAGGDDELQDRDEGEGIYIMFQYSQPRGDGNWQVAVQAEGGSSFTQVLIDTGVPVTVNHIYDMSLRCEPGGASVAWSITDQSAGSSASGSAAMPTSFYENPNNILQYAAGVGVWNSAVQVETATLYVHHAWCQALKYSNI